MLEYRRNETTKVLAKAFVAVVVAGVLRVSFRDCASSSLKALTRCEGLGKHNAATISLVALF